MSSRKEHEGHLLQRVNRYVSVVGKCLVVTVPTTTFDFQCSPNIFQIRDRDNFDLAALVTEEGPSLMLISVYGLDLDLHHSVSLSSSQRSQTLTDNRIYALYRGPCLRWGRH